MSGKDLRQALLAFDDAALTVLASKGLLRRAGRDLESGKVALVEEREGTAVIEADGERVEIAADGPAAASCSCRAPGVCRHRIAAVLLLRGKAEAAEDRSAPDGPAESDAEASQTPAQDAGDPLSELLALSRSEIEKWAGKATLRAAQEICDAAPTAAFAVEGAALVVRLDPEAPEIRYLAGQGPDGMISKAPKTKRKALHAAAILAVRRRHGVEVPAEEGTASDAPAEVRLADPAFLGAVAGCLADCVRTGFNQAPLVLEERLFALSVSSRADSLPRLAALLRTIAARVREKRERDFSLDLDAYLVLVAEAYAVAKALLAESEAPPDLERSQALSGQVRQDYQPVRRLTLYGLGARIWRTAAGARGVTGYFYAPEQGCWYSAGSARANAHDASYSPRRAYEQESLWGAGSLARLSRGKVVLEEAAAAPDGRLSLSKSVQATLQPWPSRNADLEAWSLAFEDWAELEAHLRDSFPVGLGQRSRGLLPVLLLPKEFAQPYFDEIVQETVWPLRDAGGAWLALTIGHDEGTNRTAEDFEHILRSENPTAVAALALPGLRRFELQPFSLLLPNAEDGCHNIGLDPLQAAGVGRKGSLLRRLGREAASVIGIGQGRFGRPAAAGATERILAEASDTLLGMAELGGAVEATSFEKAQALAARLQSFGLDPLAKAVQRLDPRDPEGLPPRLLEAVYLIDTGRALLRPLPSLRSL